MGDIPSVRLIGADHKFRVIESWSWCFIIEPEPPSDMLVRFEIIGIMGYGCSRGCRPYEVTAGCGEETMDGGSYGSTDHGSGRSEYNTLFPSIFSLLFGTILHRFGRKIAYIDVEPFC